jgi:hypothetical protein
MYSCRVILITSVFSVYYERYCYFGSDDGKSHLSPVSFWTLCTLKCSEVQKLNTEFQIQALSSSLGES